MKLLKLVLEYKESTVRELVDKFKTQTDKDENIIRKYINYFDKIKDNAPEKDIFKYSFQDLYDYVNMKTDKVEIDIENSAIPVEYDKEIFNQNGVEVYLSQSHKACVKYSDGYDFCIGEPKDDSYFHQHGQDKTIYFIFDRKRDKTDINHINVLLLLRDNTFEVTDASNKAENGDIISFEEIAKRYPELKGQQHLFKYVEKEYQDDFTHEDNLIRFFKSYHKTKKYIVNNDLTPIQFKNLPTKLQDVFVNTVRPIMFSLLNEKQLKRYLFLLLRNKKDMFLIDKFDNGFNSIESSKEGRYYCGDDDVMKFSNLFQVGSYNKKGKIIYNDNLSIVLFVNDITIIDDHIITNVNNKYFVLGSDGISPIIENENFIKSLTNDNIDKILDNLPKNEHPTFIKKVIELNEDFINTLTINNIDIILNNLDKNEASPFIKKVIEKNQDFIDTLTIGNIKKILYRLPENDILPFINKVIEKNKDFINTITGNNIHDILFYLPKNEASPFINKVIENNKDFINTINGNIINSLLNNISKNERLTFINKVIEKNQDFIDTINVYNLESILNKLFENEKSKLLHTLTKKDVFIKKVETKILIFILMYSKRPIALFKRLPKEKRSLIKYISSFYNIYDNSVNKDSVTKIFKHYNMT